MLYLWRAININASEQAVNNGSEMQRRSFVGIAGEIFHNAVPTEHELCALSALAEERTFWSSTQYCDVQG